MTTRRMLIDASHPEETRVIVVNGNRLEDIDIEVESRRQLKGNIYLAKVTRVEPSLQAAFVDYGGNRHGFLAFSEIHPDYYQIPVADREALIAEEKADAQQAASDDDAAAESDGPVETLGGDDTEEVEAQRRSRQRRNYKIQEVIKRRQILLVQVVKEERGTKGAALTTYLSLAGRYCVLMPNTARGGGISRKISNAPDRKRLKSVVGDLGIPEGMAVIVRTAGSKRSKAEIKRDYEYLMRLWTQIRDLTLESIAPCLVHEEGDLIKRSIRDLYNKDIEEVIVDGDDGYRQAKDFMKLLIPSHAKRVKQHKDVAQSLSHMYGVEHQLDAIHSTDVQLKSGGYIVINPTEALVSIDVNSGRATRERNIEETALKTNMEAAEEIARQLKLRDLAGLIVIDFIDMEVHRNQVKVERQLKDAMRSDRARIQIGRISAFGLMELSRQRLRPSIIETSSEPCPHCGGTGNRRSTESTAIQVLRVIEDEAAHTGDPRVTVFLPTAVALYLLNQKRQAIADVETRCDVSIVLASDDTLIPPDCRIVRGDPESEDDAKRTSTGRRPRAQGAQGTQGAQSDEEKPGKRRRRRRGRRRGVEDDTSPSEAQGDEQSASSEAEKEASEAGNDEDSESGDGENTRRRRRGRRGGRRRGRRNAEAEGTKETPEAKVADADGTEEPILLASPEPVELLAPPDGADEEAIALPDASGDAEDEEKAKKPRRRRRKPAAKADAADSAAAESGSADADGEAEAPKKPRRRTRKAKPKDDAANEDTKPATDAGAEAAEPEADAPKPKRRRQTSKANAEDSAPADPPAAEPASPEPPPTPMAAAAPELVPAIEADPAAVSRTKVIDVDAAAKPSRKGWWQRPG